MKTHTRQWRRLTLASTAFLGAAVLVAGCASPATPDAGPTAAPTADGSPVFGGNLNVQISGDPQSLDLVTANTPANGAIAAMIYDHLFERDANFQTHKNLVDDYTISDDGHVYTFELRDNVTWHDGTPLTAEDVVASLTRWTLLSGAGKTASATIESITALDTYTVEIVLNQRRYGFEHELAAPGTEIYQAAIINDFMDSNFGRDDVMGSGPYKVASWDSQKIVLERYDGYVSLDEAPSGTAGAKAAYLDTVTYVFAGETNAIVNGLTTGQFDVGQPSVDQYATLTAEPTLNVEWNAGATINTVCPNMTEGNIFSDYRARQALNLLIDKTAMAQAFGLDDGLSSLASAFVPADRTDLFSEAGRDVYDEYDPQRAKALFAEAGVTEGDVIRIMSTSSFPQVGAWATILQDELAQIGLVGEITTLDYASMLGALQQQPDAWDVTIVTFNGQVPTPATMNMLNRPWGNFQTTELQDAIKAYSNSTTEAEARTAVDELQGYVWDTLSQIVINHSKGLTAFNEKVEGYKFGLSAANLWLAP